MFTLPQCYCGKHIQCTYKGLIYSGFQGRMRVNESAHGKKKSTRTIELFVGTYPKNRIMFSFMLRVNNTGTRQKN